MSLLLNASPWNSTPETQKKRTPSIKKSMSNLEREPIENREGGNTPPPSYSLNSNNVKLSGNTNHHDENTTHSPGTAPPTSNQGYSNYGDNTPHHPNSIYHSTPPPSFKEHLTTQENKNEKINRILENMSNLKVENDGNGLYNYTETTAPPAGENSPPTIPLFQRSMNMNMKQPVGIIASGTVNDNIRGVENPSMSNRMTGSNFSQNTPDNLASFVTYSKAYEVPKEVRPYYTQRMGLSSGNDHSFEEKIMDKIQYLTHLMEEIQSEKTANINEEFILYTMLGVFVIYIVDSFSKSGKYIR
jgi:hypothetical protein